MCTSGCGTFTASTFSRDTSVSMSGSRSMPQCTSPSRLTAMTMFSGLVCVGRLRSFGNCSSMLCVTTGTVIRKMISSTSITSTNGVVLMVAFIWSSSLSADARFIAMGHLPASRTALGSP